MKPSHPAADDRKRSLAKPKVLPEIPVHPDWLQRGSFGRSTSDKGSPWPRAPGLSVQGAPGLSADERERTRGFIAGLALEPRRATRPVSSTSYKPKVKEPKGPCRTSARTPSPTAPARAACVPLPPPPMPKRKRPKVANKGVGVGPPWAWTRDDEPVPPVLEPRRIETELTVTYQSASSSSNQAASCSQPWYTWPTGAVPVSPAYAHSGWQNWAWQPGSWEMYGVPPLWAQSLGSGSYDSHPGRGD